MVDWATIPSYMHISCDSFTVANVTGGVGGSSANVKISTGSVHLDVTNAGYAIGELATSIQSITGLPGLKIAIGDLFQVSSAGNSTIPACSNFPAALDDYPGNTTYPNCGFVGYVTNISLTADENGAISEISINLSDESWKWSQYSMYPIIFNRNDATKPSAFVDIDLGYRVKDIILFMQRLMNEYGHSAFKFSYNIPDRPVNPEATNFSTSTIWEALTNLIQATYGPAYQMYSAGAGHIEIRRLTTSESTIRSMAISTDKLISHRVEVSNEHVDPNKKVDAVIAFGDTNKYYVGDGKIDNELVPAWDWWMDGYFLVIDNTTQQPAMYRDTNGEMQYVNPFYISLREDNRKTIYLPPGDTSATVTFIYGDGSAADSTYPYLTEYLRVFSLHASVGKYCSVRTYAMDAILESDVSRVIHESRFKKWRLKDGNPHIGYENVHSSSNAFVYYDEDYFPRRADKLFAGDPYDLNSIGAWKYIVNVAGVRLNQTYTTLIAPNFINSATHEIRKQRLKPGVALHAGSSIDDEYYEDIPNPARPGKPMEDKSSATNPIFVYYNLVTNVSPPAYFGPGNTQFTAERIQMDGRIDNVGNVVATQRPMFISTATLDKATLKNENPSTGYQFKPQWQRTLEQYDSGGTSADDIYRLDQFYNPILRDSSGPIYGTTGTALRWYYPIRHGRVAVEKHIPHQINQPIPNPKEGIGREPIDYNKIEVPIGIPRVEMFGFIYYEDKPEAEDASILTNLDSYYWQYIRSHVRYPRGVSLANKSIEIVDKVENQTVERQLGGIYNYDQISTTTLASENNQYFERISFYKQKEIGVASEFDIQQGNLNALSHHVMVIKFPLNNAQAKFEEFAVDRIRGKIPSGEATYYERADIKPESSGINVGVSKVVHNLSEGWTLSVTYGSGIPRLRDIYEKQERIRGDVREVLTQNSKNQKASVIGVEAYKRYN